MKKKLLSFCLGMILCFSCFMMISCGGTKTEHNSETPSPGNDDSSEGDSGGNIADNPIEDDDIVRTKQDIIDKTLVLYKNGTSASWDTFKDYNGNNRKYNQLVDRQIDVLATEIINRLYLVYGDTRTEGSLLEGEDDGAQTVAVVDKLNNSVMSTYSVNNVLVNEECWIDDCGNGVPGVVLLDTDGNYVPYSLGLTDTYATIDGVDYSAIDKTNFVQFVTPVTVGDITISTSPAIAFGIRYHQDSDGTFIGIEDPDNDILDYVYPGVHYKMPNIMSLQGSITGTGDWAINENVIDTRWEISYDETATHNIAWNWSNYMDDEAGLEQAITRLKTVIADIIVNNGYVSNGTFDASDITSISPTQTYNTLINSINYTGNYLEYYYEQIKTYILQAIIGNDCLTEDANAIASANMIISQLSSQGEAFKCYLFNNNISTPEVTAYFGDIQAEDMMSARNMKQYDNVVNSVLDNMLDITCSKLNGTPSVWFVSNKTKADTAITSLDDFDDYIANETLDVSNPSYYDSVLLFSNQSVELDKYNLYINIGGNIEDIGIKINVEIMDKNGISILLDGKKQIKYDDVAEEDFLDGKTDINGIIRIVKNGKLQSNIDKGITDPSTALLSIDMSGTLGLTTSDIKNLSPNSINDSTINNDIYNLLYDTNTGSVIPLIKGGNYIKISFETYTITKVGDSYSATPCDKPFSMGIQMYYVE